MRVILFEVETPAGKIFDVALLLVIGVSTIAVLLESVEGVREEHRYLLRVTEWTVTALFTIEYLLRLISLSRPLRYARSFFGLIDLISILPSFLSLLLPGSQSLLVIRAVRLLRIFRVLKLARFLGEANVLAAALRSSLHKISVFLGTIWVIIVILGAAMFLIEGGSPGFTSIPRSMYWAIVTMTTVGYGDVVPQTVAGQILASVVMTIGYGIIAIPTGIVTAEIVNVSRQRGPLRNCPSCEAAEHAADARYCRICGHELA
jgi:voltage-gated potassium channel